MKTLITQSYFIEVVFKMGLILLVYTTIYKIALPFIKNDKWYNRLKFYLPLLRNLFLGLLILEVIINLGNVAPIVTIGVSVIIVVLTWSYVREFFLGTIFRIQRGDLTGQRLMVDDFGGKVLRMNNTKVELETAKGEIIQIPYSKILKDVEVKPSSAKHLKTCTMVVTVEQSKYLSYQAKVLSLIASLPYVVDSIRPKIEVISQTSESLECKIVVYTNDDKFIPLIKSKLYSLG